LEALQIFLEPHVFDAIVHGGLAEKGDLRFALKVDNGGGKRKVIVAIGFTAVDGLPRRDNLVEHHVQAVTTGRLLLTVADAIRGFAQREGISLE